MNKIRKQITLVTIIALIILGKYNVYASFSVQSITTEISDRRIYIIKYPTYRPYICINIISISSNSNINTFK